jgi:hypothetical protein
MRVVKAVAVAVLCGAIPATATAAVRHATPTGTGGEPCLELFPCSLSTAVGGAANGDQVLLASGTYTVTSSLVITTSISVEGPASPGLPFNAKIAYSGPINGVVVNAPNVALRRLSVEPAVGNELSAAVVNGGIPGAVFDRVNLRSNGGSPALVGQDIVLRDSQVHTPGLFGLLAAQVTGTITGSTIVAGTQPTARAVLARASDDPTATLTIRNSILRGGLVDAEADNNVGPAATASIDIDYSSFDPGQVVATNVDGTVTLGGRNVDAAATLIDAPLGFIPFQRAGSNTIDAGSAAAAAGSAGDIENDPRVMGSAPDIGADEYLPAPTVTTGVATLVHSTGARLNGLAASGGRGGFCSFEFGTTTAYGTTLSSGSIAAGPTPQVCFRGASGLVPGTTYHFRVIARNDSGTTNGIDAVFTTPVRAPFPDITRPTVIGTSLTPASVRVGKSATLVLQSSEAGRIAVAVDRLAPGRKRGAKCLTTARTGRRCTRAVRTGSVSGSAAANVKSTVLVPSRLIKKKGTYRITVVVTDAAGNAAKAQVKTLRVR